MRRWEVTNDGDFFGEPYSEGFGFYKWSSGAYSLSQWKNNTREGIGFHVYDDLDVAVGKYYDGKMVYPRVEMGKNNIIHLYLNERMDGTRDAITVWLDDGNWRFWTEDRDGNRVNNAIEYHHHRDGDEVMLIHYPRGGGDADVVKSVYPGFHAPYPLLNNKPLNFGRCPNWGSFKFTEGTNNNGIRYSRCDNSYNVAGFGLGVIEWGDGTFCLGQWKDGYRTGYSIYRFKTSWEIFYAVEGKRDGLTITFFDSGEVDIQINDRNGRSNSLCYIRGDLSYSGTKSDSLARNGIGLLCRGQTKAQVVSFENGPVVSGSLRREWVLDGTYFSER